MQKSQHKLCIDEAYSKATYRKQCDVAIDNMLDDCGALIDKDMSDLKIAMTVHNFIINRMDYAYESDGVTPQDDVWAHNIVGCAKYGLGVCESYSDTFMFLCKNYGVNTIIVTGTAGDENHAWNMVEINDIWYGVDVTWDETNSKNQISYDCFGMSRQYCELTHSADGFETMGISYLYQLPKTSERSIELVDLLKNGKLVGTYVSVDEAFEYMVDQNSDYTVQLYSYKLHGPLMISSPDIVHNINSSKTPAVNSIVIKGEFIDLGGGFGTCTRLNINNTLTLFANTLTLYDAMPIGENPLYIQNNCLEISGEFDFIYIPVVGNIGEGASSKIVCNAHGDTGTGTEFYEEVKVYEMDVPENVTFRNKTTIIHLKAKIARGYGGDLEIKNLYGIYEYCNISLEQQASAKIQNLYSDCDEISIRLQFGKLEEFPLLTLGNIECSVELVLDGEVYYRMTDMEGNVVGNAVEKANPFNVTIPLAHLSTAGDFGKMRISYANRGDKTSLYLVDSNGDIVLKPYTIENGLVIVDDTILHYEGSATALVIPDGIKAIDSYVFFSCKSLVSVTIPQTLQFIGENAFSECPSLVEICNKSQLDIVAGSWDNGHVAEHAKHIITDESQSAIKYIDDYVFYDDGSCVFLIKYLGTKSEIVLPEYDGKQYGIAQSAFEDNDYLTTVTITQSVTSIAINAFSGCESLEQVFIPDSVLVVEFQAFGGCEKVTIYCESDDKPSGWDAEWHFQVAYGPAGTHIYNEVIWGYIPQLEQ